MGPRTQNGAPERRLHTIVNPSPSVAPPEPSRWHGGDRNDRRHPTSRDRAPGAARQRGPDRHPTRSTTTTPCWSSLSPVSASRASPTSASGAPSTRQQSSSRFGASAEPETSGSVSSRSATTAARGCSVSRRSSSAAIASLVSASTSPSRGRHPSGGRAGAARRPQSELLPDGQQPLPARLNEVASCQPVGVIGAPPRGSSWAPAAQPAREKRDQ